MLRTSGVTSVGRCRANIPLVQKLGANETSVLQEGYAADRLTVISSYAAGISPDKALLVPNNNLNYTAQPTQLAQRAHKLGLLVFPSLFRNENEFLLYTFGADPHRVRLPDQASTQPAVAGHGVSPSSHEVQRTTTAHAPPSACLPEGLDNVVHSQRLLGHMCLKSH